MKGTNLFLKYRQAFISSLFWIAVFTVFVSWLFYQGSLKGIVSEKHQSGYFYTSPLLECQNESLPNRNFWQLKKDIADLIAEKKELGKTTFVSVYLRDLNNGPWIGINEQEKFSPASLLKVPLMISYFKMAESDPQILEKKLLVDQDGRDILSQNMLPMFKVETGKEYRVADLIGYMIKYSDNLAANILLENIPVEHLNQTYSDLGLAIPDPENPENFMTVTQYSSFFRILYNASYLNQEMSERALALLSSSSFDNGLKSYLPAGTIVSHKFGERVIGEARQLHDCGIVYIGEKNYLLCVMTRGTDFSNMEDTIGAISRLVFDRIATSR
jgi:beta-lactamase class A